MTTPPTCVCGRRAPSVFGVGCTDIVCECGRRYSATIDAHALLRRIDRLERDVERNAVARAHVERLLAAWMSPEARGQWILFGVVNICATCAAVVPMHVAEDGTPGPAPHDCATKDPTP